MKTTVAAALGAALALSSCSLTIDPASVDAPEERRVRRGACVASTSGRQLCGATGGPGGSPAAAGGHAVTRSIVSGAAKDLSSSQHEIVHGVLTP